MTTVETVEAPYTSSVTATHIHKYAVSGKRPADVMAAATNDLTACMSAAGEALPANPADLLTAVVDQETGGMYFGWSEATEADAMPWESSADSVDTSYIHAYVIPSSFASANDVRATLEAAEKDAFKYAEVNDLEYSSDILGVSFANDSFTVLWSTAAE